VYLQNEDCSLLRTWWTHSNSWLPRGAEVISVSLRRGVVRMGSISSAVLQVRYCSKVLCCRQLMFKA
jgi:hypothetical protein